MNGSKKNFYLYILLAAGVVVVFLDFGVGYFVREIEASSARIVEDKKALSVQGAKNGQLGELRQEYGKMQDKTETVLGRVLDKEKTVTFITEAEGLARDNRVKLKIAKSAEKPEGKASAGFLTSSDFNFTAGGGFNDLMHFLYALENYQYETNISNVKVSRGSFDENNKDLILLTFTLKLYQKNS
jgi:hypothetical protein